MEKTAEAPESQVQTAVLKLSQGLKCCFFQECTAVQELFSAVALLFLQADPDVEKTAEAPESQVQTAVFELSQGLKCCCV